MTEGSSQGLFVIIAIVIFGIFVAISYLLFKNTMKPALTSIFNDSIDVSMTKLKYKHNDLFNPNFEGTDGWITNEFAKISAIGNNELLIEKDTFSERRGGLFSGKNNHFIADLNKKYSASIEIFIDEYIIDSENLKYTNGYESTFFIRTRLKDGVSHDFGNVVFAGKDMEMGKWVRLEIEDVTPSVDTEPNGNVLFSISIDRNAKAKIRVRNPILYIHS